MSPAAIHVRRLPRAAFAASMVATIAAIALVAPGRAIAAEPAPIVNLPIVTAVTSQVLPGVVNPALDTVGEVVAPLPIVGAPLAETTDQVQGGVNETVAPVVDRVNTATAPLTGAVVQATAPAASTLTTNQPQSAGPAHAPEMFAVQSETTGSLDVVNPDVPAIDPTSPAPTAAETVAPAIASAPAARPDTVLASGATTFVVAPNERGAAPTDDQPGNDRSTRDRVVSPSSSPSPAPAATWGESIVPVIAWSSLSAPAVRPRGPPFSEIPVRPA